MITIKNFEYGLDNDSVTFEVHEEGQPTEIVNTTGAMLVMKNEKRYQKAVKRVSEIKELLKDIAQ